MSLFTAVEMAPARPDPGPQRAVRRRHQPEQGQPRRRRLLRRQRQAAAAASACSAAEAADDGSAEGARLPADRRHRRLRHARCRTWCSAPTARPVKAGRVATVQALGGTGGLKVGADFLQAAAARDAKVLISDPSWENHRALFTQRRLRGRDLPVLRRRPRAASTSTACSAALNARRAGHHRRAARLLPQPDRLRPRRRRNGTRWSPP